MNATEIAANGLRNYLVSLADSPRHVSVGVDKDVIHVYTKRKFRFPVPSNWDGITVFHHKKPGKVMPYTRVSYLEAS